MQQGSITTQREIHLRNYFIVLDRYKWLIAAVFLVTLSITALYLSRQTPIYQAQARIVIEPKLMAEVSSAQPMLLRTDRMDLETQIASIKTTPVLALAVKQIGLINEPESSPEFSSAVSRLRENLNVKLLNNTKMAIITAKSSNPEEARDMANAVSQAYIDQDRLSRLQTGRDAIRWLSTQLADLKIKLTQAENAFQDFKEREKIVTLYDKRSEESVEIARLNASYINARTNRMEVEVIIDKIENQKTKTENLNIPIALLNIPVLQELGAELGQLQTELADKKKSFKDTYPGVIDLKNRIQSTGDKILTELNRQRDFLQAQEQSFLKQQETKRSETLKLGRKELDYLALEREAVTNREMYNALLSKVKELSLSGESDLNNVRIIEPAELPAAPIDDRKMTLVLGGILGLILGVGLAFFLKYLENTIRTPDDVELHLSLPVLSVVPQIAEAKESKAPVLLMEEDSKKASFEAYRTLRSNILFFNSPLGSLPDGAQDENSSSHPRIIVITSAGAKEGKSLTVANLGMALAQTGQKVLLVDADLRRPMLHRIFQLGRDKGLSAVLAEELTLEAAISETDMPNLQVLTAGEIPSDPTGVLGSDLMNNLMRQIREQYDIALFDSAPILGMTDTTVLASEADAVVMVIKAGSPTRKALKIALNQLEHVGAKVYGIVLNAVDIRRDRYYNYYYYYSPYDDDEGKVKRNKKERSS